MRAREHLADFQILKHGLIVWFGESCNQFEGNVTSKSSLGVPGAVWFGSSLVWIGWNQFFGVSSKSRLGVPGAVCQWRARPAASRLYLIIDLDTGTRVKYCTPATSLASSQTATNSSLN